MAGEDTHACEFNLGAREGGGGRMRRFPDAAYPAHPRESGDQALFTNGIPAYAGMNDVCDVLSGDGKRRTPMEPAFYPGTVIPKSQRRSRYLRLLSAHADEFLGNIPGACSKTQHALQHGLASPCPARHALVAFGNRALAILLRRFLETDLARVRQRLGVLFLQVFDELFPHLAA